MIGLQGPVQSHPVQNKDLLNDTQMPISIHTSISLLDG